MDGNDGSNFVSLSFAVWGPQLPAAIDDAALHPAL